MAFIKDFDKVATAYVMCLPADAAPILDGLSFIGEPLVVLAVGSAGFIAALARGQTHEQTAFILAAVAFSACTLLKLVLKRRRPHGRVIRNFGINSYSFPSGHAFGTVIFFGLLAIIDTKHLSPLWGAIFSILVAALIILIGVSRVYKEAHYPSDVIAGWLLGCISLIVVNWVSF